jgi:hypothetical protein
MTDCQHWYCGRAPGNAMERLQDQTEEMYAREDLREWEARFEEAPTERTDDEDVHRDTDDDRL